MVKAEKWLQKNGSKWQTMPELMFHYRAASFFGRLYAPDILKGMHTIEENLDISNGMGAKLQNAEEEEILAFLADDSIIIPQDQRENIKRIVKQKEVASYTKVLSYFRKLKQ